MVFFTKNTLFGKKSSQFVLFSVLLVFGISSLASESFSQSSPDFGLKRTDEIIRLEQNEASNYPSQLIISPRNGFDSPIDLKISVEPQTKFIQVKINGETSPRIEPKGGQSNLNLDITTDDRIPPGDYKVTVTGTSTINGQKIIRTQSFIIKIIAPAEFSMEVKPSKITIPQGGSGSVSVKTVLKKLLSDSFELYATFPPNSGLSVSMSGSGEFLHFDYLSGWYLPPKTSEPMNTKLQIKASPKTSPGKYTVNVVGKMADTSDENIHTFKAYTTPVEVTVTKESSKSVPKTTIKDSDVDKKSSLVSKSQETSKTPDTPKKTLTKKPDQDKTKSTKDTKPKPKTTSVEYDSQTLIGLFKAVKWAEYSQTLLLDAINQHNKDLKTQIKQDEQEYASTKDKSIMDAVIVNKDVVKKNDVDLKNLIALEGKLKDYESEIRKESAKKKILPSDFNKAAEEPLIKIEKEAILELLGGKLDEAKKSEAEIEDVLLDLTLIRNSKLATPTKETQSIKDIEWHFDGEVCDGRVTITIKWRLVGADGNHLNKPDSELVNIVEDGKPTGAKLAKNTGKLFKLDHSVTFEPKKGKTVTFTLFKSSSNTSNLDDSLYESVTVKIPPCLIDSVVDDLQPIVVIDQDGGSRKDPPKLVGEITKTVDSLKEIRENVKERIDKSERATSTSSMPQTSPSTQQQSASTIPPQTSSDPPAQTSAPPQPTQKTIKLADRNRSAVQHSVDPCLTTHTVWYQFAFSNGGYPAGDKITITESGPRGNLVHQGTLDGQGKYQIIIQNPPMQPGFEFKLTNYESSSGSKLETSLPNIWQFNVGPCVYPGTPGYPSSQPPAEQQSGSGTGQVYFVQMYTISGKNYPIYQFVSSAPDSCNDYHFHTSSGKAYAIDGSILNDPASSGCGYGKTNSMGFTSAGVYKNQITFWESLTGINIPEDD